jgi:predicted aldo/keto reductase-like oxidoreductase
MRFRAFPKMAALPISILSFGCMRLPTMGGDPAKIDEAVATGLIRQAIDAGVNYVDTAYPYHGGQSEPFVGRALRDGYRARVQLATKLPTWRVKAEADWERYLDEQLQRLETSCIDFYLLHTLDAELWATVRRLGGLAALERARADGRIRHIGFSFHGSPGDFRTILDGYDWEFCQIQYNFLDEGYQAGTDGLRLAAARGVGVVAMEPLRGGALARNIPGPVQALWARSGRPWTPAEWALRWVWDHPEVVTVLSGMGTAAQVEENLRVADTAEAGELRAEDLTLVREVRDYYHARMKVRCTTCGYCEPCPEGVDIPNVFAFYNRSGMFGERESSGRFYRSFLVDSGRGANGCTACGECEPKCPQAISIAERLKEAHAHLTE